MPADGPADSVQHSHWRRSYPILLGCLVDGRAPSPHEVEAVAKRMLSELGHDWATPLHDPAARRTLRRQIVAAARVALEGDCCRHAPVPTSALAIRGAEPAVRAFEH